MDADPKVTAQPFVPTLSKKTRRRAKSLASRAPKGLPTPDGPDDVLPGAIYSNPHVTKTASLVASLASLQGQLGQQQVV